MDTIQKSKFHIFFWGGEGTVCFTTVAKHSRHAENVGGGGGGGGGFWLKSAKITVLDTKKTVFLYRHFKIGIKPMYHN